MDLVTPQPARCCSKCGTALAEEAHYCAHCGAPVDAASTALVEQIRGVLRSELKDQKVLEVETTQLIVGRISDWAKLFAFFTAIPLTFLFGGLAIWGITKFADVNDKLAAAQRRAETLSATSTQLDVSYRKLQDDFSRYEKLGQQLTAVAAKSDTLGQELQSLRKDVTRIGARVGFVPSAALTPDLKGRLESSLANFEAFLRPLGFSPSNGRVQVEVVDRFDNAGTVATYYPSERKLGITSKHASEDAGNLLHSYMDVVLSPKDPSWDRFPAYHAIRLGLSCYFPASFLGRKVSGCQINQGGHWPAAVNSPDSINRGGNELAGVLWDLRTAVSAPAVDTAAFRAWLDTQNNYADAHYERAYAARFAALMGTRSAEAQSALKAFGALP